MHKDASVVRGQPEYYNVIIDAETGALVSLNLSSGGGLLENTTLLSRQEARKVAEEFIGKYRPAEFSRTRFSETGMYDYYPSETLQDAYGFTWERIENGIPVEGDAIQASVDVLTDRVVGFAASWHKATVFPTSGQTQSGLESQVLSGTGGLILCYQVVEAKKDPSGVPHAALVYQLNAPNLKIDQSSGGALDMYGKPLEKYRLFSRLPEPSHETEAIGESVPAAMPGQKISREKAEQVARDFFSKIGCPGEVISSGGGSTSGDGVFDEEFWSYSLRDEEGWKSRGPQSDRSLGIDVFTGEVKNYHLFDPYGGAQKNKDDSGKDSVSMETALARAVDFIKLVQPIKAGQIIEQEQGEVLRWPSDATHLYNFTFTRLVNGLPFLRDGIRVTVGADGTVTGYDCDWHAVQFPAAKGIISREDAEKIYLGKMSLKPVYYFPWEEGKFRTSDRPVQAFTFTGPSEQFIDAMTGELVEVDWQRARSKKREPSAVVPPGHWAAKSLGLLAASGLLPEEGFDPDGPVSRRDAVRVLMGAAGRHFGVSSEERATLPYSDVGPSDRDYKPIQEALQKGILEKEGRFEPDRPVDRETVAVWLVKALGYGEVAAMSVQIELKVADGGNVPEGSRNSVAIACGLGLMQGDENGLFRPSDIITWAELSSLVTRAMPRLHKEGW